MRLLLDTHIFLWLVTADPRLNVQTRNAIIAPSNEAYLSAISLWEATIKYQAGKLPLPHPPDTYLPRLRQMHNILPLPVDEESASRLASLPPIHKDPFDRMLVCQALAHGLRIVTDDPVLRLYPVAVL